MAPRPPRARAMGRVVAASLCVAVLATVVSAQRPAPAGADDTTLQGEGGTFLQPVLTKLLVDGSSHFDGLFVSYIATGLEPSLSDFVGTGPGQFNTDYAVSERPLTATEASTAEKNGRSFAYVPFAATPVAIGTLVTTTAYSGGQYIGGLCPHVDLTVDDVGALFGLDAADQADNWDDPRFVCSNGLSLSSRGVELAANDDPTMANDALMTLVDSNSTSEGYFAAGLQSAYSLHDATTTSTTPSETWPYTGAYNTAGGDDPFIGKLLTINPENNVPSDLAGDWVLGATFPISSIWTGAPLGAVWDIPTAAVQNAQGSFVAPSTAAASASEDDATLAATSDPTTNNVVTFNPSTTDAAAYNNYLMEESYLLVPTSGLSAAKDVTMADLIRFVLGPVGQRDISSFGAAPATSAMVTAGLKVAAQLDALAVATGASTGSTTTTTAAGSTSTTAAGGSAAATLTGEGSTGTGSGTATSGTGAGLAFTGSPDLVPLLSTGVALLVGGAYARRRLKLRSARR